MCYLIQGIGEVQTDFATQAGIGHTNLILWQ